MLYSYTRLSGPQIAIEDSNMQIYMKAQPASLASTMDRTCKDYTSATSFLS